MKLECRLTHNLAEIKVNEIEVTLFKNDPKEVEETIENLLDIVDDLSKLIDKEKVSEIQNKEVDYKIAVDFANWVEKLSPSQKTSVWSKNGEHSGLFTMDNEQLLQKYIQIIS